MALIAKDKLAILQAASSVNSVAATALDDQELAAVAYEINTGANTGQFCIMCSRELRPNTITTLKSQGYTVGEIQSHDKVNKVYKISWSV